MGAKDRNKKAAQRLNRKLRNAKRKAEIAAFVGTSEEAVERVLRDPRSFEMLGDDSRSGGF